MATMDRGYSYLLPRLEKEHPGIFADWKAGKYRSPRQALIAAGLKQPTKPANELRRAWAGASLQERAAFLKWATKSSTASSAKLSAAIIDADRRLLPAVVARIQRIMAARGLKMAEVMDELGFSRHDPSVSQAMSARHPTRLRPAVATALEKWLDDNKAVK